MKIHKKDVIEALEDIMTDYIHENEDTHEIGPIIDMAVEYMEIDTDDENAMDQLTGHVDDVYPKLIVRYKK